LKNYESNKEKTYSFDRCNSIFSDYYHGSISMTKDLKHLETIISMVQVTKLEIEELTQQLKSLQRSEFLLRQTK
jgi:hypothetical protein